MPSKTPCLPSYLVLPEGTWKFLEIHEVKKCFKHNFEKRGYFLFNQSFTMPILKFSKEIKFRFQNLDSILFFLLTPRKKKKSTEGDTFYLIHLIYLIFYQFSFSKEKYSITRFGPNHARSTWLNIDSLTEK